MTESSNVHSSPQGSNVSIYVSGFPRKCYYFKNSFIAVNNLLIHFTYLCLISPNIHKPPYMTFHIISSLRANEFTGQSEDEKWYVVLSRNSQWFYI